jgi:predicted NodU family carbamoyl transferase
MKVLGIGSDIWLSSAALIEDGHVIAASTEERFNRRKMSNSFPGQAINYCLSEARCSIDDIDHIAFAWNPGPFYGIATVARRIHGDDTGLNSKAVRQSNGHGHSARDQYERLECTH